MPTKKTAVKSPRKTLHVSMDEMTSILDYLHGENEHIEYGVIRDKKTVTITKEMIEEGELPAKLLGFKVKYTHKNGSHSHDGQMVEYTFRFTSPNGRVTNVTTDMCLVVGWNVCDDYDL
jgi:hypothetical protein